MRPWKRSKALHTFSQQFWCQSASLTEFHNWITWNVSTYVHSVICATAKINFTYKTISRNITNHFDALLVHFHVNNKQPWFLIAYAALSFEMKASLVVSWDVSCCGKLPYYYYSWPTCYLSLNFISSTSGVPKGMRVRWRQLFRGGTFYILVQKILFLYLLYPGMSSFIAKPITGLTMKNALWKWNDE